MNVEKSEEPVEPGEHPEDERRPCQTHTAEQEQDLPGQVRSGFRESGRDAACAGAHTWWALDLSLQAQWDVCVCLPALAAPGSGLG